MICKDGGGEQKSKRVDHKGHVQESTDTPAAKRRDTPTKIVIHLTLHRLPPSCPVGDDDWMIPVWVQVLVVVVVVVPVDVRACPSY